MNIKMNQNSLTNNQITSVGVSMLLNVLRTSNSSIEKIHLNQNPIIGDDSMFSLGEYIKNNKNIEEINISYTQVSDTGIEILVPYFEGNSTVKRFYIDINQGLTDKSIPLLLKIIELSHIEDIGTRGTRITKYSDILVSLASNRIKYGSNVLDLSCK